MEVKTLANRLAEVKAKTVRDTQGHVENYSIVNKFAATLAEIKANTCVGRSTGRRANLGDSRIEGRDTWRHIELCGAQAIGQHTRRHLKRW